MIERLVRFVPRRLIRFLNDRSGAALLLTGFLLTGMVGAVGLAMDVGAWYLAKRGMRTAVDGAALAAAHELIRPDFTAAKIIAAAEKVAARNDVTPENGGTVDVTVSADGQAVTVAIAQPAPTYFAHALMISAPLIQVEAAAGLVPDESSPNECIIILSPDAKDALQLGGSAKITAPGCGIQVNSTHGRALYVSGSAGVTAGSICVAGGVSGTTGAIQNLSPNPSTGCAAVADPLADTAPPAIRRCDFEEVSLTHGEHTLSPGVYCDGLSIGGSADVTLESGIYTIVGGRLQIKGSATVKGNEVGFYLADEDAEIDIGGNARVEITAPVNGVLEGMVFFADRADPPASHAISNKTGHTFRGTVYLPKSELVYKKDGGSLNVSPFVAVIVDQLHLTGSAHLRVDSSDSGAPAPAGAGSLRVTLLE